MRKMLSHKYRVCLLRRNHKKRTRYKHASKRKNTWKTDRDFTERWVPKPNNQAHHEYFNKDESLGMEGITVYFKQKGKDEYETRFYSILSTEKQLDGNIIYANTRIVLEQIYCRTLIMD